MVEKRRVTIHDVAREAGVSYATVSRVLNEQPGVSEQARMRVLKAIQRTRYVANPLAQALNRKRTYTIGLYLHNRNPQRVIRDGNSFRLFAGVVACAGELGYNVMHIPHLHEHQERSRVGLALCEGIVAMGLEAGTRDVFDGVPYVVINRPPNPPYSAAVSIDNRKAACELVERLITLGHRRIASVEIGGYPGEQRHLGYIDALKQHGLGYDPGLCRGPERSDMAALFEMQTPPTAVLCQNDATALLLFEVVKEKRLEIPRDVSVVSFDNVEASQIISPSLTTINIPFDSMGARAVKLLQQRIEGGHFTQTNEVVEYGLVWRKSATLRADLE